jgi:1-deoxy-D-xylulose-5-phosphate reductoisomerase
VQGLAKLAKEFGARLRAIADPDRLAELKDALAARVPNAREAKAPLSSSVATGGLVMAAVSGAAGLACAAAVDRGATVALANKECLVCAGDFSCARQRLVPILPADSSTMRCSGAKFAIANWFA